MDEENKQKFRALVREYGTNWEDLCCLEEHMEEFIDELLRLERLKWNQEMREKLQKLSIVKSYKFPPEQNKKIDEFMASLDQLLEQLEEEK